MRRLPLPGRRLAVVVGALAVVGLAASSLAASAATTHYSASTTLVVDKSFDLKTSDPQRQFEPTGGIIDHAMYDTLLKFVGADVSHPKPDAALSYKASADAKTYTFTLRKNIKFSDGTPLTSTDVVFSFNRLVNLKGNPSFLLARHHDDGQGPVHGRPDLEDAEPGDPRARREHLARHRQLEDRASPTAAPPPRTPTRSTRPSPTSTPTRWAAARTC